MTTRAVADLSLLALLVASVLVASHVRGALFDADSAALTAFCTSITSTKPTGWTNCAAPSCTTWTGVTCDTNSETVLKLVLPSKALKASVSPTYDLLNLTHLDLSYNQFPVAACLPSGISKLSKLQSLKIDSMGTWAAGCTIPSEITALSEIVNMSMINLNWVGSLPTAPNTWQKLSLLDLTGAHLDSIPDFPHLLPNLQYLTLTGVSMTNLYFPIPDYWGNMPALKELVVQGVRLKGEFPDSFALLNSTLTKLDFRDNNVTRLPEFFSAFTKLTYFDFQTNPYLSVTVPPSYTALTALNTIFIAGTKLTGCWNFPHKFYSTCYMGGPLSKLFCSPMPTSCNGYASAYTCRDGCNTLDADEAVRFASYCGSSSTRWPTWALCDNAGVACNAWEGVTCDPTGKFILAVTHRPAAIAYNIPAVSGYPYWKNLTAKATAISTLTVAFTTGSTQLQYLDISENNFVAVLSGITNLVNLIHLDMSTNKIAAQLPSGLSALSNLQYLNFGNNPNLPGTIPREYNTFSQLTYINVSGTSLWGCWNFPSSVTTCDASGREFCCCDDAPALCNANPCNASCTAQFCSSNSCTVPPPVPSPTPIPTPTPTPIPTPVAASTPIPTPLASPSPTPVPQPTPLPSPAPTPDPDPVPPSPSASPSSAPSPDSPPPLPSPPPSSSPLFSAPTDSPSSSPAVSSSPSASPSTASPSSTPSPPPSPSSAIGNFSPSPSPAPLPPLHPSPSPAFSPSLIISPSPSDSPMPTPTTSVAPSFSFPSPSLFWAPSPLAPSPSSDSLPPSSTPSVSPSSLPPSLPTSSPSPSESSSPADALSSPSPQPSVASPSDIPPLLAAPSPAPAIAAPPSPSTAPAPVVIATPLDTPLDFDCTRDAVGLCAPLVCNSATKSCVACPALTAPNAAHTSCVSTIPCGSANVSVCNATADLYCDLPSGLCSPCPWGFARNSSLSACFDVNECLLSRFTCAPSLVCENVPGGWNCNACPATQVVNSAGTHCVDCQCEQGTCNQLDIGVGSCSGCNPGWAGPLCSLACKAQCNESKYCIGGVGGNASCQLGYCNVGYFGYDCAACEPCAHGAACDRSSGKCPHSDSSITTTTTGNDPGSLTVPLAAGIPGGVVLVALVVLAAVFIMRRKKAAPAPDGRSLSRHDSVARVNTLPPKVMWHFDEARIMAEGGWLKKPGADYYMKELPSGTDDYAKMKAMFSERLNGAQVPIAKATAIFNPHLVSNFATQRKIISERIESDPAIFAKTDWQRDEATLALRQWTVANYAALCGACDWNKDAGNAPIIPVLHGTDSAVAFKIAHNGFSAISSLDAGFYGNGMYFSTDALYILPYYAPKAHPAILLCFVVPGNVFPVVENPSSEESLMGNPIKAGYQSHYVLTKKDGMPCSAIATADFYDELVLSQESQVVPAYVIEVDVDSLDALIAKFHRKIVEHALKDGGGNDAAKTKAYREVRPVLTTSAPSEPPPPATAPTAAEELTALYKDSTSTSTSSLEDDESNA